MLEYQRLLLIHFFWYRDRSIQLRVHAPRKEDLVSFVCPHLSHSCLAFSTQIRFSPFHADLGHPFLTHAYTCFMIPLHYLVTLPSSAFLRLSSGLFCLFCFN